MTILPHALAYQARGWAVVPVPPRKKAPVVDGWEDLRLTAADIPRRFAPTDNVGVILGDPSGGLVDIDVDCPEGLAIARRVLPTTATFGRASKPGSHWLYAHASPGRVRQFRDPVTRDMLVEYRANGGQTIFPGSTHESGELIAWDVDPPGNLAPAPTNLLALARQIAVDVLVERYGSDMPHEVEAKIREWTGQAVAARPKPRRPPRDVVDRARRYLAKIPGAVSGHGGHDRTWQAALAMVKGFGLATGDALRILLEDFNPRCDPPWSERELAHKVDSADRANAQTGYILDRQAVVSAPGAGLPSDDDQDAKALTDAGNAERLAAMHSHCVRWCEDMATWLVWSSDQGLWERTKSLSFDITVGTVRTIEREVGQAGGEERAKALRKWAVHSEGRSRVEAMVALAKTHALMASRAADWDADPWVLNCPNGVLDLRTGELRAHRRDDLATLRTGARWDPAATAPRWAQFLVEVQPDPEIRAYLQRLAGYAATGVIRDHCLPLFLGEGRNGKGVFLNTLLHVLGTYATTVDSGLLIEQKPGDMAVLNMRAKLLGVRLAVASETPEGGKLSVNTVKQLTGGDPVQAKLLYANVFSFDPTHKLVVMTNNRPRVSEQTDAIWNRMHLVPWDVRFLDGDPRQDKQLPDKLKLEAPGILRWVVEGCQAWQRDGVAPPDAVRKTTEDYRKEEDGIAQFIDDECEVNPLAKCKATSLFSRYQKWASDQGQRTHLSTVEFGRRLSRKGFPVQASNGTRWRIGLGLRQGPGRGDPEFGEYGWSADLDAPIRADVK